MEFLPLLEICNVYQPQTIAKKTLTSTGKYPVYGANGIIGYHNAYNHAEEEVVMGCRGSCGAVHISRPQSWINGNAMVIHPNGKYPLTKLYLKYCLLSTNRDKVITGTAQPQITKQSLEGFLIPVCPPPKQEQTVSKIEELFSDIEHGLETLKQIKEKLAAYRQAVMKSAFDSQTNNIKKIKELCSVRVGIVIKPAQYYTDKKTGIRAFRSANVKEFGVQDSDWVYLNKEGHQANKKSELQQGDILIVRSGYPGTSCVVPPEYAGSNAIDILIARPDISKIIPEYLCLFTNSPHGKKLVTKHKRGVAQAHLNVGEYSNLCIPVPSLKEQYEICSKIGEKLTMCDTIDLAINRAILQTSTLKQSILKKAFEGDLI
ncbi:MAG: restriction endonuclease subunit S [Akkermansia sp.]|nr:restriction endonuclease subunit S [Akkermansia sp.]